MKLQSRVIVEAMREEDIPAVQAIERDIFASPWPRNAYHRELHQNRTAHYIVVREEERVVGYAGLWRLYEEAHITTIGVSRSSHGKGYGRILLLALINAARERGARWVTLEVRASNEVAIRLYEKFGFKAIGRRRGYYSDNGEDAIVMWSDSIHSDRFQQLFDENRALVEGEIQGID